MDVISGSLCFDPTFEPAVVSTVRCIGDAQIVDSLVGPIINSENENKICLTHVCLLIIRVPEHVASHLALWRGASTPLHDHPLNYQKLDWRSVN